MSWRWETVLIKEDFKVPRNVWKLGRVVELVNGRDGNTRRAKLIMSVFFLECTKM